ncbi:MAG: hypothetical protein R3277_09640 [Brumimicrobium sp.]|nr:hypothetical protein [Brumimicrobium sp.]
MEQLRKVVAVSGLTYFLYGLISWFQLGVFLPPLPFKSILFVIFFFVGIYGLIRKKYISFIDLIFFSWLGVLIITEQSLLEFFFSEGAIIYFQINVEIYLRLLEVLLFVCFNTLIIFYLKNSDLLRYLFYGVLLISVICIFIFPALVSPEYVIILISLLYFLRERFSDTDLNVKIQHILILLYGISFLELVEAITLIL